MNTTAEVINLNIVFFCLVNPPPIAVIVLAVLFGLALLGCVVMLVIKLRERKKKQQQEQPQSTLQTDPPPNVINYIIFYNFINILLQSIYC